MLKQLFISLFATLSLASVAAAEISWKPLCEPGPGGWVTGMRISPHDSQRILVTGDMLGVGLSEDGGESWQPTFGFKSWEMADVTWSLENPEMVWVGSASGPYLSMDGGRNWELRRKGMPEPLGYGYSAMIEKILIDPEDESHLLAFGGSSRRWDDHGKSNHGAVWESRDGGLEWVRIATLTEDGFTDAKDVRGIGIVSAAAASGNFKHLYAAVDGRGIYVSQDGGRTWKVRNDGFGTTRPERVIAHPTDPQIVFCSLDNQAVGGDSKDFKPGGIYKSIDGGRHWSSISNGLVQDYNGNENFTARYKAFAISRSNPDVMYTANHAWFQGAIFTTRDGGANWTRFAGDVTHFFPAGLPGTVMEVDPQLPDVAWCLGSEHMLQTRDGGKTWKDGGNIPPGETKAGWRGRGYSGMCATQVRFNPAVEGVAMLQAFDSARAWLSRDNLRTWTRHFSEPDAWGAGNDTAFAGKEVIYVTTSRGTFTGLGRSRDAGETWEVLAGKERGLPELDSNADALGIHALASDPLKAWACIGGALHASTDGGDSWQIVHHGPGLRWIAADPRKPERFFVSGKTTVLSTEDGRRFTAIGGPRVAGRMTVDAHGRLYLAAEGGDRPGLWRYTEGRWTRLFDEKFIEAVAVDPLDPQRIAVATNQNPYLDFSGATGVWVSSDDGRSWSQQNEGLPMLRGYALAFNPHDPEQLILGTQGRGFFTTRWEKGFDPAGVRRSVRSDEDEAFAAIQKPKPLVVLNGAMDDGTDVPEHWNKQWTGAGKIAVLRDTGIFKSAPASLSIRTEGTASGQTAQMIEAEGGRSLTLRGALRTAGNAKVNVAVQSFGSDWQPISFQQAHFAMNENDWTAFTKELTLPDGCERFGVVLLIEGDGQAWLDDVQILGDE